MKLVGRYGSPFVRRVAATLKIYGIAYDRLTPEYRSDELRAISPAGRVPALQLDDGSILVDSSVIIDYLDHLVGPDRALIPMSGPQRSELLSLLAIATTGAEKLVVLVQEAALWSHRASAESRLVRLGHQIKSAFEYVDRQHVGPWICGDRMTQLDVSCISYWYSVSHLATGLAQKIAVPNIQKLVEDSRSMAPFFETQPPDSWIESARERSENLARLTNFESL